MLQTGTLTEDGLDMWGVVPVTTSKFLPCFRNVTTMPTDHLLMSAMVTCHSITSIDGKLSGDPLDLKMFESTEWLLEEPETSEDNQFDLVMPVVVRPPNINTFTTIEQVKLYFLVFILVYDVYINTMLFDILFYRLDKKLVLFVNFHLVRVYSV